jgi:hypothetical protein
VRYVDAGYVIALSVIALYAAGLIARRRRLTRAVARAEREHGAGASRPLSAAGDVPHDPVP